MKNVQLMKTNWKNSLQTGVIHRIKDKSTIYASINELEAEYSNEDDENLIIFVKTIGCEKIAVTTNSWHYVKSLEKNIY